MNAIYICKSCGSKFEAYPGPTKCSSCGNSYLEWTNFNLFEESHMELKLYPNPILNQKCTEVSEFNSDLEQFCIQMINFMIAEKGIGLAANQIGDLRRIFVMRRQFDKRPIILINPKIVNKSGHQQIKEGCLSFPGLFEVMSRNKVVNIEYQDVKGKNQTVQLEGIDAVCAQHEIDHLDGITFVDRMSRLKKQIFLKKMKKRH